MTSQRETFEKWADADGYMLEKLDDNYMTYEFDSTRYAWYGYQAAKADQAEYIAMLELNNKFKDDVNQKLRDALEWSLGCIDVGGWIADGDMKPAVQAYNKAKEALGETK